MVHEVPGWDSDSDYVEEEEHDELDQQQAKPTLLGAKTD